MRGLLVLALVTCICACALVRSRVLRKRAGILLASKHLWALAADDKLHELDAEGEGGCLAEESFIMGNSRLGAKVENVDVRVGEAA